MQNRYSHWYQIPDKPLVKLLEETPTASSAWVPVPKLKKIISTLPNRFGITNSSIDFTLRDTQNPITTRAPK